MENLNVSQKTILPHVILGRDDVRLTIGEKSVASLKEFIGKGSQYSTFKTKDEIVRWVNDFRGNE